MRTIGGLRRTDEFHQKAREAEMKKLGSMKDTRDGWYSITPADALLLVESQDKNRPLVESRAEAIAEAIKANRWSANGESMVLDHTGNLIDGQHRCRAAIIANMAITAYVVHLPKAPRADFFDSIDQGKTRTAADRLSLEGVKRDKLAAAVARLLIQYDRYGWTDTGGSRDDRQKNTAKRHVTVTDIRIFNEKHRERLEEATEAVGGYAALLRGWIPASLVGFVYYKAAQEDKEKAAEFLHGLATGENLTANSPAFQLRKRLQSEAIAHSRLANRHTAALAIKAWNSFYTGVSKEKLQYNEAREEFPSFATKQ